jgi:hypothetical protein
MSGAADFRELENGSDNHHHEERGLTRGAAIMRALISVGQ